MSVLGVGGDDELDAEPLASPLDESCPDDLLIPIERIEKYHNSEELFDRCVCTYMCMCVIPIVSAAILSFTVCIVCIMYL